MSGLLSNASRALHGRRVRRRRARRRLDLGGLGRKAIARCSRAAELPFDSDCKRMTTLHGVEGARIRAAGARRLALVEGAPDVILGLCSRIEGSEGPLALDAAARAEAQKANDAMASEGLRVLAVAYRPFPEEPSSVTPEAIESDLVLLGLFGMQDSPRPEVAGVIAKAREAGL